MLGILGRGFGGVSSLLQRRVKNTLDWVARGGEERALLHRRLTTKVGDKGDGEAGRLHGGGPVDKVLSSTR